MRQTIMDEYDKCKRHYDSLKLLDPEPNSAT